MIIEQKTFIKKYRTIHLGYGTTADFKEIESPLSKTITDRLVKHALQRLDSDLKELVLAKKYRVVVERITLDDQEKLNESDYQVSFINQNGLMISVDGIWLKNYRVFLDHGVSLAENQ